MLTLLVVLLLALAPLGALAQTEEAQADSSKIDEVGEWLDDHTTFWEGKGKISGQIRFRVESFNDFDFDDDVNTDNLDDDFGLSRLRLAVELKPNDVLRLYFQLQDSHQFETDQATAFREGPAAREDRVDIYQAYVDVAPFGDLPLTIRAGRQVLSYGDQRLIGGFDWSNTSRSFNAVKMMYNREQAFLDVFFANVVIPEDRHFNTEPHADDVFVLYCGWKQFPGGVWEGYFLVRDDDRRGFPDREIYTFGTRIAAKYPGNDAIDYSIELVGQTGDLPDSVDQEAFAAHFGGGYTFKNHAWTPRIGLEYNYSTGDDDPTDGDNETFDNLYPTNHLHYGYMDRFSWRNMHDFAIRAKAKPMEKLTIKCDLHFFWLDDADDAWYNAGGGVIRPGTPGADEFVGEEIDLVASYKYNKNLSFSAGYSHFFAGDFVDDTGSDDDADWLFFQTVYSF
jgi:hypothetical protein